MNQRIVIGIILVFVITVFTQCTVQKRLYRKGWNVEFRHKYTSKDEGVVKKNGNDDFPIKDFQDELVNKSVSDLQGSASLVDSLITTALTTEEIKHLSSASTLRSDTQTSIAPAVEKKQLVKHQSRPYDQEDKRNTRDFLLILFLGFLLVIIVLSLSLSEASLIGSFLTTVALVFFLAPVAAVLLVALLVVTFSKTQEELESEQRQADREQEQLEDMTPEEQDAYQAEQAPKEPNQRSKNIVAAVIAGVIVFLAIFVLTDK
jgi:ABC-type nickel/cobalt efflux system permease component RcnA